VTLTLYNTLTRRKEPFRPIDPGNVRMYVCGPTVYDFAHIGNARPAIVFDVLFRLLRHIYGADHVTYARNITDVDDKINARAAEEYPDLPLNEAIRKVTEKTEKQYREDVAALGVLPPTVEPRATEHIAEMRALIETLIDKGRAYVAQDHVLFDVASMPDYGRLSNRSLEEMEAGARVEVAPYKKGPMDFVLWKPSKQAGIDGSNISEPAWPSPRGVTRPGRPGWHIECSAMAEKHLGRTFDIHGGGIDLVFPHHENELAQTRSAFDVQVMATNWMHNGFLQVEGEKMSKSLGNFVTINELLATKKFGSNQWHGRVIRLAMLGTHYRQPIDWTVDRLVQARLAVFDWADWLHEAPVGEQPHPDVLDALGDDLNTPAAVSVLHALRKSVASMDDVKAFKASLQFLGLYENETMNEVNVGYEVRRIDGDKVRGLVAARNAARKAKNFKEADRIRDELTAMGIQLKDAKNPTTGEIETTWEVKR
jgi:cysteinyl-tRNA synthetase